MPTADDLCHFNEQFKLRGGYLYCEGLKVLDLRKAASKLLGCPCSPLYIYSQAAIEENVKSYVTALARLPVPTQLNYAVKANCNVELLRLLRTLGCSLTLVSGNELLLALEAGFSPASLLFNGNGKTEWERELAVRSGCLVNVDSDFDLRHTAAVAQRLDTTARVLLRVNPDIDAKVHPYVSTGLTGSKFGVSGGDVEAVLETLARHRHLRLEGLHCHLGSTITSASVFRSCIESLLKMKELAEKKGFTIEILNIGGGLGIDYRKHEARTRGAGQEDADTLAEVALLVSHVTATLTQLQDTSAAAAAATLSSRHQDFLALRISKAELGKEIASVLEEYPGCDEDKARLQTVFGTKSGVASVAEVVRGLQAGLEAGRGGTPQVRLLLEPGRSLVASSCILLCSVLGTKSSGSKRFVVTDGAMTEVMRPCLYGAYHHVELAEPSLAADPAPRLVDVVGPVCESADFLAKDRFLASPHEGCSLAVFHVGAYCASMASNYNLRMRPAEVLVSGTTWRLIRRPDTLEDLLRPYRDLPTAPQPSGQ